jgi:hypothetical protein
MLAPACEVLKPGMETRSVFRNYADLASELCVYLKEKEVIGVRTFSTPQEERFIQESFEATPIDFQKSKLDAFINYYNHCVELSSRNISLRDKKESLRCFSYLYGLKIPSEDEIYALLGDGTYVEIYDLKFTQRYRSADWLETTSYSLMAVEALDWRELFFRSENILQTQMELVTALYEGNIKQPVYRPVEIHTVKELRSKTPLCAELESLVYAPVIGQDDKIAGGLHVLKIHNLRSILFSVCDD